MTELEYWTDQIKKSRISRREFMGRVAALGVTTALATTMLSQAGIGAEPKKGGFGALAWRMAPPPTRWIQAPIPTPGPRCRSGGPCRTA